MQSGAETRSVYDQVADTYADHFRGTEGEQPIELAMIEHFISLLPSPRRVLDAGCGAGRMLPFLGSRGCIVEGIDLSAGMIRRAQADHPGFATRVGSLVELPYPDSCVDGVFAWYSTIHSPDEELARILEQVRRVLVPGGYALLGFQTGDGVRDVAQGYRDRGFDVVLDRYHRSADAMVAALAAAGLDTVARFERIAVATEQDGQAVVIARR